MGGASLTRRGTVAALAVLVAGGLAAPITARAAEPGPEVVEACEDSVGQEPEVGRRACRNVEQLLRVGAQLCRHARDATGGSDDPCTPLDGLEYSGAAMQAYEASDVHATLVEQAAFDDQLPLRDHLFPGTHNSFNAAAYTPTLSGLDHNQIATLTDQLRMDMRGLEIDVHWAPSADPADGGLAPIMCHGEPVGPVHFGCTAERHLRFGLAEIREWVDGNPEGGLVLLYLENNLDGDDEAHAQAAATIEAELGDRVVTREEVGGTGCASMPLDASEADLLQHGRVLIVGNCGPAGSGWHRWVHERGADWHESGSDHDCGNVHGAHFERRYEDSTWLSAMVQGTGVGSGSELTSEEVTALVDCGVNLLGFDQLTPGDPRLGALADALEDRNQPAQSGLARRPVDPPAPATPGKPGTP